MSKFTIKVKLQGLEIEVEGTREDAPKIAQRVGQQFATLLQPAALLSSGNGNNPPVLGDDETDGNGSGRRKKTRKSGGSSGSRTPTETINLTHDSATLGSPTQDWTTVQKAIWFLHIVNQQASVPQMTANNIAKNFNKYFRLAGIIQRSNVATGLEKERLKGTNATVGADMADGTAKYFLTQAGITMAQRLAAGETVAD